MTIIDCIQTGKPIPANFYRVDRDTTLDQLLTSDGIMHLHLGHPGTRELLFLKQYDDHVVLLEVSNHYHFETDPPGTVLRSLHDAKVKAWETERENEKTATQQQQASAPQTSADKNAAIRASLGLKKKNEAIAPKTLMRRYRNLLDC